MGVLLNLNVGGNKYCGRNMLIEYRWWEGLMIGCHIHFGLRIGIHPKTLKPSHPLPVFKVWGSNCSFVWE